MQAVKINVGGIKCDNKDCDFKDMDVKFDDYPDWLNKPCPKCGSNLLTEQDYFAIKTMIELTAIINETMPDVPDEQLFKISVELNGDGKARVSEIEPIEKEG